MMYTVSGNTPRLRSLDVFRGMTIAFMIIVNTPGSWQHMYTPLRHADWHGCTPADLVFPFFLFITGSAMFFPLARTAKTPASYRYIMRRCSVLFLLGMVLNCFPLLLDYLCNDPVFDLNKIRIMGVLQRIALTYLLTGILVINCSTVKIWLLGIVMLLGYWAALSLIPVPGYGVGMLTPAGNLPAYIDRLFLTPSHMYRGGPYDPEGISSSFNAAVTVLAGYGTARWLHRQKVKTTTSVKLALAGLACLGFGGLWDLVFPINKALWTSSYVVFTAGWALLVFAAWYEIIEVRSWCWLGYSCEVLGRNAIFVFVASSLGAHTLLKTCISTDQNTISTYSWIYQNLFASWAGNLNGSLAFACTYVFLWWFILYIMYRRRWFIRI